MYPLPPTIPTLANLEFFNDLLHRLVDPGALLARRSVARFAKCFHCGSPTEDDKAVQRSFPDLCSAIGQAGRQKGNGILRAVFRNKFDEGKLHPHIDRSVKCLHNQGQCGGPGFYQRMPRGEGVRAGQFRDIVVYKFLEVLHNRHGSRQ